MRILAFLPTHEPPPHLVALAASGHDVHLVATRAGAISGFVEGVRTWSTGFWWQAWQQGQPHVVLTQVGDRAAERLTARMGRPPLVSLPADPGLSVDELTAVLAATVPRNARQAAVAPLVDATVPEGVDVIAWAHYSVPYRRAGSEVMLHIMLRSLAADGLRVLALTSEMPEAPPSWEVDGVEYRQLPHGSADMLIRRARPRVLVTHHHLAPQAIAAGKAAGARTVLVQHNDHRAQSAFLLHEPDLVVFNTDWVRDSIHAERPDTARIPHMVVHPPVDPDEHRVDKPGDHVTLVNLSANKGVHTFRAVAGLLPDVPFLGVVGAHGVQETAGMPPNVTVVPHTSDMRGDVWARTRVVLMPSVYESYGLVSVEALASGVPVIAHPTPGLREALGDAGVFVDRDDHQAWADAIRGLYRGGRRRGAAQGAARDRSAFLTDRTTAEMKQWTEAVRRLI